MTDIIFRVRGLDEFASAIRRNPDVMVREISNFLTRAKAELKSYIRNDPWRLGMSGGGCPVKTGNLRDTHIYEQTPFRLMISPNETRAPYAEAVHRGRPWLEYSAKKATPKIEQLSNDLLKNIIADLIV